MLATMLNVDPACGLVNVVNVDVWSWVVRRKCKNLAILSDFKRFWTIFGRFGTIWDHFPACFAISRGSSIAGRVTTANVDNMLSAEPSKCWNMLNVDWTCKCCVPHVEHFPTCLVSPRAMKSVPYPARRKSHSDEKRGSTGDSLSHQLHSSSPSTGA